MVGEPYACHYSLYWCVFLGLPASWLIAMATSLLLAFIREQSDAKHWTAQEWCPRCQGTYIAMHVGISYRKGQQQPGRLRLETHELLAERLLNYRPIQWITAFGSSKQLTACSLPWLMLLQVPFSSRAHIYTYITRTTWMHSILKCLTYNKISLTPSFLALSLTLEIKSKMYKHQDSLNCPFGWCVITILWWFNSNHSGHIILWETKMVIEFSHASIILIPSTTITYLNVPVANGNLHTSFMQFCSGNLFWYMNNGYCTDTKLSENAESSIMHHYKEVETISPGHSLSRTDSG